MAIGLYKAMLYHSLPHTSPKEARIHQILINWQYIYFFILVENCVQTTKLTEKKLMVEKTDTDDTGLSHIWSDISVFVSYWNHTWKYAFMQCTIWRGTNGFYELTILLRNAAQYRLAWKQAGFYSLCRLIFKKSILSWCSIMTFVCLIFVTLTLTCHNKLSTTLALH